MKGQFKFSYSDTDINGNKVLPCRYCVDEFGNMSNIVHEISKRVAPVRNIFFPIGYMQIILDEEIQPDKIAILDEIVDNHKSKHNFTDIELKIKEWADSEHPVRDVLPSLESDLDTLVVNKGWANMSWIEKRIAATWNVCSDVEVDEVLDATEKETRRFYSFYKYISPKFASTLSHNDIYVTPIDYDFKIYMVDNYYKKMFPYIDGRPTKKEYYKGLDGTNTPYGKFAQLVFSFTDSPNDGLIIEKVALLQWVFNNGDIDEITTKNIGQDFLEIDDLKIRIEESNRKRRNIFETLRGNVIGLISITEQITASAAITKGVAFIKRLNDYFQFWLDLGSDEEDNLINAINNNNHPDDVWLDNVIDQNGTTIRQYITATLDIT